MMTKADQDVVHFQLEHDDEWVGLNKEKAAELEATI